MRLTVLVDYLAERWEEEDDTLDRLMRQRGLTGYIRINIDRLLADIAAKRKTLSECENAITRDGDGAGLARTVLNLLAEPYTDRADFPSRTPRK